MLKTRLITAALLLVLLMSALFYFPPLAWLIFASLIAAIAAWEWGALLGQTKRTRLAMGAGTLLVCADLAAIYPDAVGLDFIAPGRMEIFGLFFYLPATIFWLLIVPFWLKKRWVLPRSLVGLGVGVLLIFPTWLALVQLRQISVTFLLAVMGIVWVADSAAYFFGRAFGRHKLAPNISPGKTWEGALGGGLAVIIYGFGLLWYTNMLPENLSQGAQIFLLLAFLAVISVMGDLFESLLKRQAGLKDSSHILPGHGGILDRIDSLTSTLPLVGLLWCAMAFSVGGFFL